MSPHQAILSGRRLSLVAVDARGNLASSPFGYDHQCQSLAESGAQAGGSACLSFFPIYHTAPHCEPTPGVHTLPEIRSQVVC